MASERTEDAGLPVDPDLRRPEDVRPPEDVGPPTERPVPHRRPTGALRSRLRPAILGAIAAGGALGGAARYGIERALPVAPGAFPWATFAVNVSGSLVLALLLVFILEIWPPIRYVRPFAAIGFLGAYTTFSTWMVETAELVSHGRPGLAAGYLIGSLLAGLAAVSLGLVLGRAVLTRRTHPTVAPDESRRDAASTAGRS